MNPEDQYAAMMEGECGSQQSDYCKELTGKTCTTIDFYDCPIASGDVKILPENILVCKYHGDFFKQDLEIIDEGIRMCPICYNYEKESRVKHSKR